MFFHSHSCHSLTQSIMSLTHSLIFNHPFTHLP
jgi:hypothetical protein